MGEEFVTHQRAVSIFTAVVAQAVKRYRDRLRGVDLNRLEALIACGDDRGKLIVFRRDASGSASRVEWIADYQYRPGDVVNVSGMDVESIVRLLFDEPQAARRPRYLP
jgi:hypothetical protein